MPPSIFLEFLGDYPLIRVLDFLIENDIFDYPKKDICKYADVAWNTLESLWPQLEAQGIVTQTRKVGKATLYKLNTTNPGVKQLLELNKMLIRQAFDKWGTEEKIKAVARSR